MNYYTHQLPTQETKTTKETESLEDLAKIAEILARPILHTTEDGENILHNRKQHKIPIQNKIAHASSDAHKRFFLQKNQTPDKNSLPIPSSRISLIFATNSLASVKALSASPFCVVKLVSYEAFSLLLNKLLYILPCQSCYYIQRNQVFFTKPLPLMHVIVNQRTNRCSMSLAFLSDSS